jgi:hypothetical protein
MHKSVLTLKGFANLQTLSGFNAILEFVPRVLEDSNPELKLANAFGVLFKLNQYPLLPSLSVSTTAITT